MYCNNIVSWCSSERRRRSFSASLNTDFILQFNRNVCFLLQEDTDHSSLQHTRCSRSVNSLESVSGNGKWRQKWGDSANELLIIRLSNHIFKKQQKMAWLQTVYGIYKSNFHLDFDIANNYRCYLKLYSLFIILYRQTENNIWHPIKARCRNWIRDAVAAEHMS